MPPSVQSSQRVYSAPKMFAGPSSHHPKAKGHYAAHTLACFQGSVKGFAVASFIAGVIPQIGTGTRITNYPWRCQKSLVALLT